MLGNDLLNATIRIWNGPPPDQIEPSSSLSKFMVTRDHQTNQKKRGKYKTNEKCKRVDTLVDVDTDSETESSDGKDKNIEFW